MLNTIARSLDFVRGLRIGDPIPKEVLTGDASWQPSLAQKEHAGRRVTAQLVCWSTGEEVALSDPAALRTFLTDRVGNDAIRKAQIKATMYMGIGEDGTAQGARDMDELPAEMAFTEALRSRSDRISRMGQGMNIGRGPCGESV